MKITALVPWFGSKRSMAPLIVEQLGPHRCYFEPFCGSMAVLLAKPECSQETVNDLHGDLINLARVIQHPFYGPQLYRRQRRCMVHENLFDDFVQTLRNVPFDDLLAPPRTGVVNQQQADRAFVFFYGSWMGRNGVIGTKEWNNNFCKRYTMNGGIQGTRFASAVDSIPAWRRRIREVTILRMDGFELLEKIEDDERVAIYADPPYLQKGATYRHDFEAEDHARLAKALGRFRKARCVLSYYADQRLEALYPGPGWTFVDCARAKSLSVQGQRGSKSQTAPEVLILNGPSRATSHKGAELF